MSFLASPLNFHAVKLFTLIVIVSARLLTPALAGAHPGPVTSLIAGRAAIAGIDPRQDVGCPKGVVQRSKVCVYIELH